MPVEGDQQMENEWIVRTNDFKESHLDAVVIPCSQRELVTRALKRLFAVWGIAVLCILVPVFHFVLVPLFVLLGPIVAYRILGYKFRIKSGSFLCPECKKSIAVKELWFKSDLRSHCEQCGTQVAITRRIGLSTH